ncbi:bifunctional hydroxymethylpyrimidine kinase/phosphomethylpyrimidine kinase [bacterium]|nr:bifunctional hydroxymethylpyrimidine kinase/phosphomethylpyrimidine kinase [bacterium]
MMSSLVKVIEKFFSTRILVIGDVILDQYIWGDVNRISPEAPVPVVEVQSENFRLGGAANTVANIRSLSGKVDVVSVVGKDENGNRLQRMVQDIGVNVDGLLEDGGRPTIIKTRVIARNQQVLRIDREAKHDVDGVLKKEIIRIAEDYLSKADAVIVSDYDKGVVSKDVLEVILPRAKEHDKPVVIDPKIRNFWNYKGATVVTPNLKEASAAFGRDIIDDELLLCAGNTLLEKLELDAVLITRGEHGMSLFEAVKQSSITNANQFAQQNITGQSKVTHIPTVAREVFDVTGAGDTVVAVFTLALAAGANMLDAATIANYAAGIVVGEVGTASVIQEELIESIRNH